MTFSQGRCSFDMDFDLKQRNPCVRFTIVWLFDYLLEIGLLGDRPRTSYGGIL